jgi:hypothetical protein
VAQADFDCQPLGCVPPRQNRKNSSRLHPIFFSGPLEPSACSLATRCGAGIQQSAHSARMATVQPDRVGAGSARAKKSRAASLQSVPIFGRSGTCVEQLDYLTGARAVSKGHHG